MDYKELFTEAMNKNDTRITELKSIYNFYAAYIDDGRQHKKAIAQNKAILKELKELGVKEITNGDKTVKVK